MSNLRIAPDAQGEMTVWNGDDALVRQCEVDRETWVLIVLGVETLSTDPNAAAELARLERDAIRTIGLFLSVLGGRLEVPDNVTEALDYDAVVVRWRDEAKRVEVWELHTPDPGPPAAGETPVFDQLAAEQVLEETRKVVDGDEPG